MEKKLEKNQEYMVEIIDQGYEGEGIAKIGQIPVFIPNAIVRRDLQDCNCKGTIFLYLWKSARNSKGFAKSSKGRLLEC